MFFKKEEESPDINRKSRCFHVGAEVIYNEGVNFRVWASDHKRIEIALLKKNGDDFEIVSLHKLAHEERGYFSAIIPEAKEGSLYKFKIDDKNLFPDPASRFQPYGPHGPSQVINPDTFPWTDFNWKGKKIFGEIIYEMHIGTFTKEGSWNSAAKELPELAELGISIIEVMPVADFAGNFGWGYDGVNLFAPTRLYGSPDDFKNFVNEAHQLGIGVILDVVFNHFGPDGNYLREFSQDYFTDRYKNDWGEAINFDGENSEYVREYFITNARYWIKEFHLDGLRLDATQDVNDSSPVHILSEITIQSRKEAGDRSIIIIAENEPQEVKLLRNIADGGFGMDAVWNDDFHHSAMVAITGHNEAYYTDYHGKPQEFISSAKWGFLYQGQRYKWQNKRRGTPSLNIEPEKFILYIQNHDQIANSAKGYRAHQLANFGLFKTMTTLLLVSPGTPMFFQGQEFGASSPFLYFADHKKEISGFVKKGRSKFLSQFRSLATPEMQKYLPDPSDENTFLKSKLDFNEREKNKWFYRLHKDLIRIRKENITSIMKSNRDIDGAVLSDESFLLRYFFPEDNDMLVIFNLGKDLHLNPAPEPLLAPPENKSWNIFWSTENPEYGGYGTAAVETDENWRITGYSAVILTPEKNDKQWLK